MVRKSNSKDSLWNLCNKFIKDNDISCSETIYQTDRVITNAHEFIEKICDIVGYSYNKEDA